MSKSNRNEPHRALSSDSRFTRFEFDRMFPDDAACLGLALSAAVSRGRLLPYLQAASRRTIARRLSGPRTPADCGHHVHPMRGTIFEDSADVVCGCGSLAIYLIGRDALRHQRAAARARAWRHVQVRVADAPRRFKFDAQTKT